MINEDKVVELAQQKKQVKKQKGASLIEYGLVVAAIVGVGAIAFGGGDGSIDKAVKDKLDTAAKDIAK